MRPPRRADNAPSPTARFDLIGRVVLVTGASRGLGAAMAAALAEAGADLILWARTYRALLRHATRLRQDGYQVLPQAVDVTQPLAVRRALRRALARFGRIDVLINNAGIWGGDAALKLDRRTWDAVLDTDLSSTFFLSQAVARAMAKRRYGKIINVASTSGIMALPYGGAAYGTAKAGLMHLTRILAVEWGPRGIRVVGIAPGVFRTDMTRDMFDDHRWATRRLREIPLHRFGEPEDLAGLAVFLSSRASDHITGQTIVIDGGASLTT